MNLSQKAIIDNWATTQLVIAGAGSGKTTTMAAAIQHEIMRGISPKQIVAITFTGSAASVLRTRVPGIGYIGTLHGFMLHLMRKDNPKLSVLDEEDAEALLKASAAELNYRGLDMGLVADIKREWWRLEAEIQSRNITKEIRTVAHYYRHMDANALDYDSILRRGLKFVLENTKRLNFASVYVDEFQDSSSVDLAIYDALSIKEEKFVWEPATIDLPDNDPNKIPRGRAQYRRHMFFVGDPNQSIYGFRGARVQNIFDLAARPDVMTYFLNENYRSTPQIVDAASAIIAPNEQQLDGQKPISFTNMSERFVWGSDQPAVDAVLCSSMDNTIMDEINSSVCLGLPWHDIAVLARTNAVAWGIKAYLMAAGVPVKSMESVTLPRDWKIARKAVAHLAYPQNWDVAFAYMAAKGNVFTIAEKTEMMKTSPKEYFKVPDIETPGQALNQLVLMGVSRTTIIDLKLWLENHPCQTAQDMHIALLSGNFDRIDGIGVYVGTIHSAKGHEWESVILAGVENTVFPLPSGSHEEERRLMYVAITRAKSRFRALAARGRVMQYNPAFSKYVETGPSGFFNELLEFKKQAAS